eukprot:1149459-Pyramimonas_sp.AAC.1
MPLTSTLVAAGGGQGEAAKRALRHHQPCVQDRGGERHQVTIQHNCARGTRTESELRGFCFLGVDVTGRNGT